jgi:hypothetical protein
MSILAGLAGQPAPARACSCADGAPTFEVVFVGRVVAVIEARELLARLPGRAFLPGSTIALLDVELMWQGPERPLYAVVGGSGAADCTLHFDPGHTYLVYGQRRGVGPLETNVCVGSREMEEDSSEPERGASAPSGERPTSTEIGRHEEPPSMLLLAPNGERQPGGIGSYCWTHACVDKGSTPYPAEPLVIGEGEVLRLDVAPIGDVPRVSYEVYASPDPAAPDVAGAWAATYATPLRRGRLDVLANPVALPNDLPPGLYVIDVFVRVRRGGDSYQGFTVRVVPAAAPAASDATPIPSA